VKAEASGYASWVRSPEVEDRYIRSFYKSEGIQLNKDTTVQMLPNAILQNCLNTQWGKFTERNNRTQSKMISDPQEL
jgi:hypothetical protein